MHGLDALGAVAVQLRIGGVQADKYAVRQRQSGVRTHRLRQQKRLIVSARFQTLRMQRHGNNHVKMLSARIRNHQRVRHTFAKQRRSRTIR